MQYSDRFNRENQKGELMLTETQMEHKRGTNNVERRLLAKLRRKNWKSNYNARRQAIDQEQREMMKRTAHELVKKSVQISKQQPGLVGMVKSLFRPRAGMSA